MLVRHSIRPAAASSIVKTSAILLVCREKKRALSPQIRLLRSGGLGTKVLSATGITLHSLNNSLRTARVGGTGRTAVDRSEVTL